MKIGIPIEVQVVFCHHTGYVASPRWVFVIDQCFWTSQVTLKLGPSTPVAQWKLWIKWLSLRIHCHKEYLGKSHKLSSRLVPSKVILLRPLTCFSVLKISGLMPLHNSKLFLFKHDDYLYLSQNEVARIADLCIDTLAIACIKLNIFYPGYFRQKRHSPHVSVWLEVEVQDIQWNILQQLIIAEIM